MQNESRKRLQSESDSKRHQDKLLEEAQAQEQLLLQQLAEAKADKQRLEETIFRLKSEAMALESTLREAKEQAEDERKTAVRCHDNTK